MPAVTFLVLYTFLLLCVPSRLIVAPLGSPGTPANLFGIFLLLWWVVATLGGQNQVRGLTPLRATFGLLALAVLASYAAGALYGWYAPAGIHAATDDVFDLTAVQPAELRTKMISAADRGLLSFAGWAGVLLMTAEGLRSWRDLDLLLAWLIRFAGGVAALGIVQYFTGVNVATYFKVPGLSFNSEFGAVSSRSDLNRISSTAVHPIEFGVVMAVIFALALHRSLHARSRAAWIPTVLIGLALPMSVSRSAILVAAISLLIVFAGWPSRWRWRAILVLPFAVVGLRLLAPGLIGTIRALFVNIVADPSVTGRTSDYGPVLGVYAHHPVLGRGLFTFVPRYYRILDNQVLMTLLELGAVGLAALLVLFSHGYLMARGARRRARTFRHRQLGLTLSGGVVGLAVSYVTFDAWGFPMVAGTTFLLLGLAGATARLAREDASAPAVLVRRLRSLPVRTPAESLT
jgi:hypothetical protein